MKLVWLLDRATALVTYPSLFLAVLTGIFYSPKAAAFGFLHETAQRIHVEISVFATIVMLAHAVVGVVDAGLVLAGVVPAPPYPIEYFVVGVLVGAGALLLLVVAILGFVDARRFQPPWDARIVHSFAYAGFGFGTVHAVAIGTDVTGLLRVGVLAAVIFVGVALVLRLWETYDLGLSRLRRQQESP